jgi:hypothetical protein
MKKFLLILLVWGISVSASGSSYYVSDVNTSDANPDLARSVRTLLISAVSTAGGQVSESSASADYTLKSDLVRLGQAYVLTVSRVNKNGQIYSSHQKANAVEDLDEAADRAVRAAMVTAAVKSDIRVGEVKKSDEDTLRNRVLSKNFTYLGFGPAGFQNMGTNQLSYDLALGHYWEVTPQAAIKFMVEGVASRSFSTYIIFSQLGLNYYFTDESTSLYVGAGIGFGFSWTGSSSATTVGGFAGNLGLGCQFFRTSSTQFDIFGGYTTIFGNNTIGAPGFFGGRIGVLF